MQINNVSMFGQDVSNPKLTNGSDKLNKEPLLEVNKSATKPMLNSYDVHHISPNEFKELITELRDSGQISVDDSLMLTVERYDLEHFGGISKDTQIDMVAYFEEQIDVMKSTPGTKGVEYQEWTLNLLKAIDAKNGANIPKSV